MLVGHTGLPSRPGRFRITVSKPPHSVKYSDQQYTSPSAREVLLVILAITLLGAIPRFVYLGQSSLWLDEAMTYWITNGGVADMLRENIAHGSGGVLFPFLVRPFLFLSDSEVALRAPACIAGVAGIPVVYLLCRLFINTRWAYGAALMVAMSPTQIRYSQELREYSFAFLIAALLLIAFVSIVRHRSRAGCIAFAALAVVSLLMQYGLVVFLVGLNALFLCLLLIRRVPTDRIVPWVMTQLAVLPFAGVVYALWIQYQLGRADQSYLSHGYWHHTGQDLVRILFGNTWEIVGYAFPFPLVFAGLCAAGIYFLARRDGPVAPMMLGVPLLVACFFGILGLYPYHAARQSIYLLPMFYVLAAAGLHYIDRARGIVIPVAAATALAWGGISAAADELTYRGPEHIRPLVAFLSRKVDKNDVVFVHAAATPAFRYYLKRRAISWGGGTQVWPASGKYETRLPDKRLTWIFSHEGQQAVMSELAETRGRIWVLDAHIGESDRRSQLEVFSALGEVSPVMAETGAWLYVIRPR